MEQGCSQNAEVEDLVTGSAEIEASRRTPFWNFHDEDDCTLDVDVSAKRDHPGVMRSDIFIHELEHNEHARRREAKQNEHDTTHRYVLCLIKLWHQCDDEAGEARCAQHRCVYVSVDYEEKITM